MKEYKGSALRNQTVFGQNKKKQPVLEVVGAVLAAGAMWVVIMVMIYRNLP